MRSRASIARIQQCMVLMPYWKLLTGRAATASTSTMARGVAPQMLHVCEDEVPVTAFTTFPSTIVIYS